jgi:1-deoxy-D-xylulose-5-phosphate synthase
MLLDSIQCPADLRGLTYQQLDELGAELRQHIIDAVAKAGGHLGSNLGAVELTLALHRVFDSPHDILLWDTGHQAYVHKIITGRAAAFDTLRQAGGISGYPCQEESEHDWVENSHASTIISYAHGLALAQELAPDGAQGRGAPTGPTPRRVVAVIGDGSLTGGMAFEGLNNLGHSNTNAILVLNDNGRSYAPTVSKLGESLAHLRVNPSYMRNRARLDRMLKELPVVGKNLERGLESVVAAVREMFEPPAFFETLGVRYTGPFDGHDIAGLEKALRHAAAYDGPIVVHVRTQKGRGYGPAENDPVKHLHDMSPHSKPGSYTAAFTEAMIKEAEERPELVAITAAMPDSTGLLPFGERFPGRLIDVGIAEQHAVTSAAGMAMAGLRPVVAVYSTFLTRAIDQVTYDVGLHGQPVVFCLDRAGITGDDGASHHGVLDMALLTKVPGMTVFAPSSYQELGVMLHDALDLCTGPAAIRWSKTAAPQVGPAEVGSGLHARKAREGRDLCVLAVGKMVTAACEAAEALADEGIEATVWDVRVVTPPDPDMLADAAEHPLVITAEDGVREGGAGSLLADRIAQLTDDRTPPRVRVLGTPIAYIPHGNADAILAELGLDAAGLAAEARRLVSALRA